MFQEKAVEGQSPSGPVGSRASSDVYHPQEYTPFHLALLANLVRVNSIADPDRDEIGDLP